MLLSVVLVAIRIRLKEAGVDMTQLALEGRLMVFGTDKGNSIGVTNAGSRRKKQLCLIGDAGTVTVQVLVLILQFQAKRRTKNAQRHKFLVTV
jgi:hypothetical protein